MSEGPILDYTPPTALLSSGASFGIIPPSPSNPLSSIERQTSVLGEETDRFSPEKAKELRSKMISDLRYLLWKTSLHRSKANSIEYRMSTWIYSAGDDALTLQVISDLQVLPILFEVKNPTVIDTILDVVHELIGKRLYPIPGLQDAIYNYAWNPSKVHLRMLEYATKRLTQPPPTEITFKSWSPDRYAAGRLTPALDNLIDFAPYLIWSGLYFGKSHCLSIAWPRIDLDEGVVHEKTFADMSMVKCPYNIVVLRLSIIGKNRAHANLLVVNKTSDVWEIERFDSNGESEGDEQIDTIVKSWLSQALGNSRRFIYKSPMDVCPAMGPQARSARKDVEGFCQTWIFLYWHLRMDNPEITGEKVLESLLAKKDDELFIMVQKYAQFMHETTIPPEFIDLQRKRSLCLLMMGMELESLAKLKLDDSLLNDIQEALYDWIAKVEDAESCETFLLLPLSFVQTYFPDPAALRLVLVDLVRLLTGRRIQRSRKFERRLRNALFDRAISQIQKVVDSTHLLDSE